MEKMNFLEAGSNLLLTFFSRGLMYALIVAGLWLLISGSAMTDSRARLFQTLGIILLGSGLGLLGVGLAGIRLGQ